MGDPTETLGVSTCAFCLEDVEPSRVLCSALDCSICGKRIYHNQCMDDYLRRIKMRKDSLYGYPCPNGKLKAAFETPISACSGKVICRTNLCGMLRNTQAKEKRIAAMLAQAQVQAKSEFVKKGKRGGADNALPGNAPNTCRRNVQIDAVPARRTLLPAGTVGDSVAARMGAVGHGGATGESVIPGAEFLPKAGKNAKRQQKRIKASAAALQQVDTDWGLASNSQDGQDTFGDLLESPDDAVKDPTWISDPLKYEQMINRMYGGQDELNQDNDVGDLYFQEHQVVPTGHVSDQVFAGEAAAPDVDAGAGADLAGMVYTVSDWFSAGYQAVDLRAAGYSAVELLESGLFPASELLSAGYSMQDIAEHGSNLARPPLAGGSKQEVSQYGSNWAQQPPCAEDDAWNNGGGLAQQEGPQQQLLNAASVLGNESRPALLRAQETGAESGVLIGPPLSPDSPPMPLITPFASAAQWEPPDAGKAVEDEEVDVDELLSLLCV